jgi:uncharacterized protein DUF6314
MTALADPRTLVGAWRLSRVIDDRLGGGRSEVDGQLSLTEISPDRIRWEEQGLWHQPTGDVVVRRGLWLVRDEDTDAWWVRFEDERDFHPWLPGEAVVHPCAPDTYRGVVTGTPERWTVEWDVTGPAKDYSMRTELTRGR